MKKFAIFIIISIIIILGVFLYATRPVEAPQAQAPLATSDQANTVTAQTWSIDSSKSEAKFEIDEELRGKPFHVVGQTGSVAGDLSYDPTNNTFTGLVSVDGATIKTDSAQRDGAIARLILHTTDQDKRFITFTPKSLANIPPDAVLDTEYDFTLTGILTVNGVSREVTWSIKGKASTGGTITGVARATIKRGDFGLVIPNIPFVANVGENVDLTLNFSFIKN